MKEADLTLMLVSVFQAQTLANEAPSPCRASAKRSNLPLRETRSLSLESGHDPTDEMTFHVGQPPLHSVVLEGELLMIQSQQAQNGGVEVI